jgi:putative tricarboxylic transport membrane protein
MSSSSSTTTTRRGLLAAGAATGLAAPAMAQTTAGRFPERPVEIVVGFAAGGGTDLNMRSFARFLEARLGGPVVVINRPGAGTEVAMASVARARPDGHTLGAATMPTLITIPIERQAQFRLEDFAGIGQVASDPNAVTVHAQAPWRAIGELIEAARREPDRLTFASSGAGTDDHLQLVLLQEAAGIRMTHVTYPGSAPVRTALLSRQIDAVGLNVGEVMGAPESMRMLAQAGPVRSRFAPDVSTFRELGLAVEMSSDRGLIAPAGTPAAVLERLREAAADAARDPDFARQLEAQFTEVRFIPEKDWFEGLRTLQEHYRALWARAPWRAG